MTIPCSRPNTQIKIQNLLQILLTFTVQIYILHMSNLTLFDMGASCPLPKMFLTTVLKRLGERSWNLVTFNINLWRIRKSYFWFPGLSGVTMAMSSSGSTRDFLKLSLHMFPYNEILKVFKSKLWLDIWNKHPKILLNTKFHPNRWRGLGVTSIWNLGLHVG